MKPNKKQCSCCHEWDEDIGCWLEYKKTEDCEYANKTINLEASLPEEEEMILEQVFQ